MGTLHLPADLAPAGLRKTPPCFLSSLKNHCQNARSVSYFPPDQSVQSVQSLSRVRLFATPCITARQASLSITNSWSLLKLMSIESMMPSSHLILCRPLLLLPPIPPSIKILSNESTLRMRWPKYWRFSLSISASNEQRQGQKGRIHVGWRNKNARWRFMPNHGC